MYLIRICMTFLLLFAGMHGAWALRSDRDQPIDIKADRVEVDQHKQISHYIGNVHMQQGSLKIDADDVVVYMVNGKLHKIIISGNPARFQQKPDNQRAVVVSRAQEMEYYAAKERLLLKHDAEVTQGGNHFHGDYIEYDTLTSTVKANKSEDGQSRVHAIIQPATEDGSENQASPDGKPANPPQTSPAPKTDKP